MEGYFNLDKKSLKDVWMITFKYKKHCYKEYSDQSTGNRTRSPGLKLQQENFRLDIRKSFSIMRVTK